MKKRILLMLVSASLMAQTTPGDSGAKKPVFGTSEQKEEHPVVIGSLMFLAGTAGFTGGIFFGGAAGRLFCLACDSSGSTYRGVTSVSIGVAAGATAGLFISGVADLYKKPPYFQFVIPASVLAAMSYPALAGNAELSSARQGQYLLISAGATVVTGITAWFLSRRFSEKKPEQTGGKAGIVLRSAGDRQEVALVMHFP